MARRSIAEIRREQDEVLNTLRENPAELTREELREKHELRTGKRISLRQLKVRLDELHKRRLIDRLGRNNPRYKPAPPIEESPLAHEPILETQVGISRDGEQNSHRPAAGATASIDIPLSRESEKALKALRQPRSRKNHVTYRPEFLDDYRPGSTWYLPAQLRADLRELGTTAYAGQPAGTYALHIMQRLIIDLSWGSSRLEGNKYSRIDTEELLKGGEAAPGTSDVDRQMILNHKEAIEFLVENAQEIDFNRYTLFTIHAALSENLLGDPAEEGRLRTRLVSIGDSIFTPTAIPQLIEERFDAILAKARAIPDPMEQSFFMMVHIPYLQPFLDVNKRTSRLAANISLIKANLCPLSFVDVPQQTYTEGTLAVYEQNDLSLLRDVYAWAYQRSCEQFTVLREAMGTPDPIRLNYRTQLRDLVTAVVKEKSWPDDTGLQTVAASYGIPQDDRDGFVAAARSDLVALRPEKLGRYRLRLSEYEEWIEWITFTGARR